MRSRGGRDGIMWLGITWEGKYCEWEGGGGESIPRGQEDRQRSVGATLCYPITLLPGLSSAPPPHCGYPLLNPENYPHIRTRVSSFSDTDPLPGFSPPPPP
eukprot:c39186_g1_i1 orf=3-302(-)